jgi:hypothetical protein
MNTTSVKALPANGALFRAERLRLRVGTRECARQGGTTFTTINFIEKENGISTALTLAEVTKIAQAAGLTPLDLLTPPKRSPGRLLTNPDTHRNGPEPPDDNGASARETEPDPVADARTLAQVLVLDSRLTEEVPLCRALGWTLPQLRDAMQLADQLLEPVGLRVHQNPTGICLRPTDPDIHATYELVLQQPSSKRGYNVTEARMLRDAIIANVPDEIRHGEKPAVGSLVRQAILRPGQTGEPSTIATDGTLFAFDIDGVRHTDLPVDPTWKAATVGKTTARKDFVSPGRRHTAMPRTE